MKLLLIEDDPNFAKQLVLILQKMHTLEVVHTLHEAATALALGSYDLILADVHLPDGTIDRVIETLRTERNEIPILVMTGNHSIDALVSLLNTGADDYLPKPFTAAELQARIMALSRRRQSRKIVSTSFLSLQITDQHQVFHNTNPLPLRRKEVEILLYLIERPEMVIRRSGLWRHVWSSESEPFSNAVDVHIRRIRNVLKEHQVFDVEIATYIGLGYSLQPRKEVVENEGYHLTNSQ
jgi:two-component system, OmpR family, alkaline phosphatase synthesis response regulator PhoP